MVSCLGYLDTTIAVKNTVIYKPRTYVGRFYRAYIIVLQLLNNSYKLNDKS